MAYNDLTGKLEEALKWVVDNLALAGVTINTGVDTDSLTTPFVACTVTGAGNEEIIDTGIMRLSGHIMVASSADDTTLANHRQMYGIINDAFFDSAIAKTLSDAVSDFHCYAFYRRSLPSEQRERKMINNLEFEAVVCASDIG